MSPFFSFPFLLLCLRGGTRWEGFGGRGVFQYYYYYTILLYCYLTVLLFCYFDILVSWYLGILLSYYLLLHTYSLATCYLLSYYLTILLSYYLLSYYLLSYYLLLTSYYLLSHYLLLTTPAYHFLLPTPREIYLGEKRKERQVCMQLKRIVQTLDAGFFSRNANILLFLLCFYLFCSDLFCFYFCSNLFCF